MLSDYLAEKKMFAKGPEFWHVGFVSPEKHCSEFFSLGCSSLSRYYVCKQGSVFQAVSIVKPKTKETFCFAKA